MHRFAPAAAGIALLAAGSTSFAQTVYPIDRAEILAGTTFDFKVEFPGLADPAKVSISVNGEDHAKAFGKAAPFIAGEPIREQKLVKANGSGFMAAILPTGMRAISTEISPETGAGGFILPNDRVDVILSKREKNPDGRGSDVVQSEIILSNIRVLAIDQAPKEKEGVNSLVGRTVTLELKPEQAETLARARQSGTLSLALRSITDVNAAEGRSEDQLQKRSESVNVVRYGVANQTTAQK